MTNKLDHRLVLPGLCIVATSYGLARYAYGLYLPIFREAFALSDATLALVAAISYASYFCITVAGIYLSTRLAPRLSVLLGGMAAVIGMAMIAAAQTPFMLGAGVAIAGVSPGLAYTPFSEIIATLVSEARQRVIYSVINSGTSLGVMLSGPAAILLGERWRVAWGLFAAFGLLSTLWCVAILPRMPARAGTLPSARASLGSLATAARLRLFVVSFLIGIAASIYWAFSVDLVTAGGGGTYALLGVPVPAARFGQVFWTLVGLAGFASMATGAAVERLGVVPAMRLCLSGVGASMAMIALGQSAGGVLISGLLFGAFFMSLSAVLGMWSLELFQDLPAVGFGLTFLLLSAGQFFGPLLVGLLIEHVALGQLFIASAGLCAALVMALPYRQVAVQAAG
ncbi:YbfB/YjiJ family MFS transporter [Aromatoleum toluvorans]|uniref:YbfB/YjiJ family MFS transporter n=1 Tax=Aromatoleum toluvorans TaxID=92002 RepID=A0ABX1Q6Z7_9RHOO|nr:YbfB/YjiJ family MFS transporter [Aromatoleum toluvorans]NMG46146.1 YbfB/YjiJ family MFS transporter [Aromatoleum toluvorans]